MQGGLPMTEMKLKAMRTVAAFGFAMYDAQLYLDAYPECPEAVEYYFDMKNKFTAAAAEYEKKYGPLTASSPENRDTWKWSTEPWPWQLEEGGNGICGRI